MTLQVNVAHKELLHRIIFADPSSLFFCTVSLHQTASYTAFLLFLFTYNLALYFYFHLLQLIGPQFVRAIEPSLTEHWTPEVEDAWLCLFKLTSVIMQEAMIS